MNHSGIMAQPHHAIKKRPIYIFTYTSWIVPNERTFDDIANELANIADTSTRIHAHKFKCTFGQGEDATDIIVRIYANTPDDFLIEFQRWYGCTLVFNNTIQAIMNSLNNGTFRRPFNA